MNVLVLLKILVLVFVLGHFFSRRVSDACYVLILKNLNKKDVKYWGGLFKWFSGVFIILYFLFDFYLIKMPYALVNLFINA